MLLEGSFTNHSRSMDRDLPAFDLLVDTLNTEDELSVLSGYEAKIQLVNLVLSSLLGTHLGLETRLAPWTPTVLALGRKYNLLLQFSGFEV